MVLGWLVTTGSILRWCIETMWYWVFIGCTLHAALFPTPRKLDGFSTRKNVHISSLDLTNVYGTLPYPGWRINSLLNLGS